jgi:hypothetical protein
MSKSRLAGCVCWLCLVCFSSCCQGRASVGMLPGKSRSTLARLAAVTLVATAALAWAPAGLAHVTLRWGRPRTVDRGPNGVR